MIILDVDLRLLARQAQRLRQGLFLSYTLSLVWARFFSLSLLCLTPSRPTAILVAINPLAYIYICLQYILALSLRNIVYISTTSSARTRRETYTSALSRDCSIVMCVQCVCVYVWIGGAFDGLLQPQTPWLCMEIRWCHCYTYYTVVNGLL